MDAHAVAQAHAAIRTALGVGLIAAPRLLGAAWVGRDARRTAVKVYSGALGARDLALGAGVLAAAASGTGARPWLTAGMVADAVDFAVTVRHRRELPAFGVASVSLMAGGSAVLGAWLRSRVT